MRSLPTSQPAGLRTVFLRPKEEGHKIKASEPSVASREEPALETSVSDLVEPEFEEGAEEELEGELDIEQLDIRDPVRSESPKPADPRAIGAH